MSFPARYRRFLLFPVACCWLLWFPSYLAAQQAGIGGYLVDSLSREPVMYAAVAGSVAGQGVYTDERGYFYLTLAPGDTAGTSVRLRIQHVGYRDTTVTVDRRSPTAESLVIRLRHARDLPVVDVGASAIRNGYSGSVFSPAVERLRAMPVLLGEADLLKGLLFLPGISTGLEGTANIQIRGGNPSQTHVLLDGVTLYNSGHLGGFLSSVDPYGVKGITVYKGGVPAEYGGRLSGLLDIDLRQGRRDRHTQEFSAGTATVRAGGEGPLGRRGSYVVSGRYSYPSLIVNAFGIGNFKEGEYGNKTSATMYDATIKTAWDYGKHQLSTLLYHSGDNGIVQSNSGYSVTTQQYHWSTSAASVRDVWQLAPALILTSQLSGMHYGYGSRSLELQGNQTADPQRESTDQRSTLSDLKLSTRLRWYVSDDLIATVGTEVTQHTFRSTADRTRQGQTTSLLRDTRSGTEAAGFAQLDMTTLADRLRLQTGLRLSTLAGTGQAAYLEPRLKASLTVLPRLFLNAGYDRHAQYVHQLTTDLSLLPSDVWILADRQFIPSRSSQVYLGLAGALGKQQQYSWSIEVFDKDLDELIALRDRDRDLFSIPEDWRSSIAARGRGRARGAEFFLAKEGKRLSSWVAYTLSRSERNFPAINDGEWFPYTFDRRHDGSLTLQYTLPKGWTLNSAFVYQTGQAVTFPIAATADFFLYDRVNNARVPDYHRLDLSASRTRPGKKRPANLHTLTLGLFNAYNRANPVDFRVEIDHRTSTDPATGQTVLTEGFKIRQVALFPVIPSISYRVEFH